MIAKSNSSLFSIFKDRTFFLCLFSAAGIYFSINMHRISILIFAVNIISLLFLSYTEIFCELFFLFPFMMVYKMSPSSTSLFTYLMMGSVFFLYIRYRVRIKIHFLVLFLIFLFYLLAGSTNNITGCIKLLFGLLLVYFFVMHIQREYFAIIILYMSLGTFFSALIGLRKNSWPALRSFYSDLNAEYINGTRTHRFSGLYQDPNYFSIIIIICILCLLIFAYLKELNIYFAHALSIILAVFGLLTYSKIFYVILVAIILILISIRIKSSGKLLESSIIAAVIICAFYYLAYRYGIIANILYRFRADDISNNRYAIWSNYISYFGQSLKTLIVGDGIGCGVLGRAGAHNFYLELIYYLGLIGGSIYISLCLYLLKAGKKIEQYRPLNFSLLLLMNVVSLTLGMLLNNDFPFILMSIWIVMNTDIKRLDRERRFNI